MPLTAPSSPTVPLLNPTRHSQREYVQICYCICELLIHVLTVSRQTPPSGPRETLSSPDWDEECVPALALDGGSTLLYCFPAPAHQKRTPSLHSLSPKAFLSQGASSLSPRIPSSDKGDLHSQLAQLPVLLKEMVGYNYGNQNLLLPSCSDLFRTSRLYIIENKV